MATLTFHLAFQVPIVFDEEKEREKKSETCLNRDL